MTTKKPDNYPRVYETAPVVQQDTIMAVVNDKKKENLLNHPDFVVVGAVPIQHSCNMANVQQGGSFMSTDKSNNHVIGLELAASAAMAAGRRSEASAALIMKTFPRLGNGPILPLQTSRITAPSATPSAMKKPPESVSVNDEKRSKKLQPKKQRAKKATKKASSKITKSKGQKKRNTIKGHRSSWNLFVSDFASANPRIGGGELVTVASKKYKLLTKEEKAHYDELSEADRIRILAQEADRTASQSNLKLPSGFVNSHIQYSNLKNLLPFLKEQETNINKLVPGFLKKPQSNAPCIEKTAASCTIKNLEKFLWSQQLEQNSNILASICACLDMKSLAHLELCSSILHGMDLVRQERDRREHRKNPLSLMQQGKNSYLPLRAASSDNNEKIQAHPDRAQLPGSLDVYPAACNRGGLFESFFGVPTPTSNSTAPSTIASSQQEKKMKPTFLPSCFDTRPPIDPFCTLPTIDSFGFRDAGVVGEDKTVRVGNRHQKLGKNQVPPPPPKNSCNSTLNQATPCDIAKQLLHEFLNQYGLFWPFQYWLLHVTAAQVSKINPHSNKQQGTLLHNHTLPIHMYYHDPLHPFRKFFHPCSAKYLSVMDNLSGELAKNIKVLEEFRNMAHDVAVNYTFFRDGLHYVLQTADALAYQPLLGIPDFHAVPSSETIYNGTCS